MRKWKGIALAGAALALALGAIVMVPPSPPAFSPMRVDGRPIRVEVLNGSGVRRAGLAVAQFLRERGFDVVGIRNADRSDYEETVVLDRVGVPEYALAVADEIGVGHTFEDPDSQLLLEVTVILGRDRGRHYGERL